MVRVLARLVRESVLERRSGLVPALYSTQVRYQREPKKKDEWLTALETYHAGHGDCEDLCVWLCADLIVAGDAHAQVILKDVRPGLRHALVLDGFGNVRDPSRKLGMKGPG